MCELDRLTDRRTTFSSAILARVRRERRIRDCFLSIMAYSTPARLLLLGFLEHDLLTHVTNALAFVRLGASVIANVRRHLPHLLTVRALDDDFSLSRRLGLHALGQLMHHRMRKPERKIQ